MKRNQTDTVRAGFRARAMWSAILGLTLAACGGGGGSSTTNSAPAGTIATNPATGLSFVVDDHRGGAANELRILDALWGRLVDIQDVDGTVLFRDFVIGDDIKTNCNPDVVPPIGDYFLERNPVTEREVLTICHKVGTPGFDAAFARVETNLQRILNKSISPSEIPPFTAVPRNGAVVLRFNDLLNDGGDPGDPGYPGRVNMNTVKVLTGYPPTTPYELRVLPDPNHGDVVAGQFHSTRVILDMTVSSLEAQDSGLQPNSLGLPEAVNTSDPSVVVRIPTRTNPAAAQFEILTNLSGKGVSFGGNGQNDPTSPTLDVIRGFRSGGRTNITGDLNNGFLEDEDPPRVLGSQPIQMTFVGPAGNGVYLVDYTFGTLQCATRPRKDDVLDFGSTVAEVVADGSNPIGGSVGSVPVRLLAGDPNNFVPQVGVFRTAYDPAELHIPACFVRFSPAAKSPPVTDVEIDAAVVIAFSEPMDPASVQAFDTLTLSYDDPPNANPLYRNVVGHIVPSVDLREFAFEPEVNLNHPTPTAESYTVTLSGVTDLAGNSLLDDLPATTFTIDPSEPIFNSRGVALRFNDGSFDDSGDGFPEVRGQILWDADKQAAKPRSVNRFSAVADPTVPVVGSMIPFTQGIQTPLSNLGSRTMIIYRYHDFGFGLRDDETHNLDLEGLAWEPFSGNLNLDKFTEFEIVLSHSVRLPDEAITNGLLPDHAGSGILPTFAQNYLDPATDPPTVIHPRDLGYDVQPLDVFDSVSNRRLAPWPINRTVPSDEYRFWTWRDTSVTAVGGPSGVGADTGRLGQSSTGAEVGFYPANQVPTIGLPMLVDFKTYPDTDASGLNGFKIALAINSSARPYFRSFSTGSYDASTVPQPVDPDQAIVASGSINPVTFGQNPPQDNVFYYGQGDFVVRVSRMHTIWFDMLFANGARMVDPVKEPIDELQPNNTSVSLAFRGASGIGSTVNAWENANNMDSYGNSYTSAQITTHLNGNAEEFQVSFFPTPNNDEWTTDISTLNGARFVQARVTFVGNPETALVPDLSALGIAFFE